MTTAKIAPRLVPLAKSAECFLYEWQFYGWAIESIPFMSSASEADVIRVTKPFPLIRAVWLDEATRQIRFRTIKGREPLPGEAINANALPVADEAEALRWAAILNTADATPPAPGSAPQLVTKDGARVSPDPQS